MRVESEELRKIIETRNISAIFRPVVSLISGKVLGYEALFQGDTGVVVERSRELFEAAYETNIVLELDRLCRKKALESAKRMDENHLFFLNIDPEFVSDPDLRQMATPDFASTYRITPGRIVLEVTEYSALPDSAHFLGALRYLRSFGFQVSINDVGRGDAGLKYIAEVKPEFIKTDTSLVRDIDDDAVKQELVRTLVMSTRSTDVKVIAAGIETTGELETLVYLGVELGQGYLFGSVQKRFAEVKSFEQLCSARNLGARIRSLRKRLEKDQ